MKRIVAIVFMLVIRTLGIAQVNVADYTDAMNVYYTGVDTQYQLHNEIKTLQEESNLLNKLFPFNTNQVNGSANSIQFFDTLTPKPQVDFPYYISWGNGSNYYRAQQLSFKLNQDTSYSFCYKNNAIFSNSKTAYVIIPGSGLNQATGIAIYNPANYHNVACTIAQTCRQYGDVFTYVRPNEDFASLWTTTSPGVRRKMSYEALTSKTNLTNKNWAANCYIQINALVKYLQTKYDKVVVLGLSSGAWGAMFTTLQTEPDAAVLASGYSISFHDLTYTYTFDQMHYDGLFSSHPIDSVRKKVRNMNTQFLLSYGYNDQVTHIQDEHDNHTTQNYFNTPTPASNTSYFYNFSLHRFPCEALDSFFTRIKKMPKAFIEPSNQCNSDSLVLNLRLIGTPPFQGMIYRNDIPYQTFNAIQDTLSLIVYDEGDYQIKNLLDSNLIEGFKSKIVNYHKVPKLQIGSVSKQYICQTDSTHIQLPIIGTPPYTISILNNTTNQLSSFVSTTSSASFYKKNGNYTIQHVSDQNQCIWQQGQIFSVQYASLNSNINSPIYDCDSNKNKITFHLSGNAPWTINYFKNGTPISFNQNDSIHTYWYENGQYLFNTISDNTGCSINTNQIVNLNGTPIQVTLSTPSYNCDSNKTELGISSIGNGPFNLVYSLNNNPYQITLQNNNQSILLNNGQYHIAYLQDATGCVDSINNNYTFNYDSLKIAFDQPFYNCDSNKTQLGIHFKGNGPWTLTYTWNGNNISKVITDTQSVLFLENGQYQFNEVTDQTGCTKLINQVYSFTFNPISASTSAPIYNCNANKTEITINAQGNSPYHLIYNANSIPSSITLNNGNNVVLFSNGSYSLNHIVDATGCLYPINLNFIAQYDSLEINPLSPVYNCDSNKTQISLNLQGNAPWTLNYTLNGTPQQALLNQSVSNLFFTNGLYQFLNIVDSTGCSAPINQSFNFNYQALSWNLIQQVYDCNSNLYKTQWAFTGNAPWTIQYTLNGGGVLTQTFNNALSDWYLPNGQYQFISVSDATSCQQSINFPLTLNFVPVGISLSNPVYNCDSNKTHIAFTAQGNAPWVLNYTINGSPQQIVLTQSVSDLYFVNGLYQFLNVIDSTGCTAPINQSFNFNYQALSWNLVQQVYDCNSNLYKTQWAFTGNAPWTIQYTLNGGSVLTQTFNNALSDWYLPNGQYQFISLTDSTTCQQSINFPLTLNFVPVGISLSAPIYNCDSNKTHIAFTTQGNAPWVLNYTFNGSPQQIVLTQSVSDLYFANGLYQFLNVIDSTGCTSLINQSFNFNYQALSWNLIQQVYDCNSNLYKTQWAFTGNAPWTIQYTLNGGSVLTQTFNNALSDWYLPNGQYQFISVTDSTTCQQGINFPLTLNFVPVGISLSTPVYNCDSNKTHIAFTAQGNAPWVLNYSYNGSPQQIVLTQSVSDLFFVNGLYQFLNVIDSTGCTSLINQSYNFNYQALSWNLAQQSYNCDSNLYKVQWAFTGNAPWVLTYELVGGFVYTKTYSTPVADLYLPNGQWHILSISDVTGCVQPINIPLNLNFTPLSVSTTTPQYDCDSNKMKVAFNVQGNQPFTFQVNQLSNNTTQWLSSNLNNPSFWWPIGQYLVQQVTDATGCIKPINQYINHNILPLAYQTLARQFDCDSQKVRYPFVWQGNAPWILSYKDLNNGFVYSKTYNQANASLWLATGQYALLSITDAYCSMPMNDTLIVNFPSLNAQVATPGIQCDSNKAAIVVNLQSGLAPVYLNWVYNGVPDSLLLHAGQQTQLLPNGSYYFNQLRDSTNCILPINQSYTANYTPLTWNSWQRKYNCTLDTNDITFNINGANNTGLFYTRNGISDTLFLQQGVNAVQWGRGQYHLAYLRDTAQCIFPIDTTFIINDVPLALDVANLHPICIDKVHEYTFNVKGKAPWVIEYNYGNATQAINLPDSSNRWICAPGRYDFVQISDANQCELSLTRIDSLPSFIPYDPVISTDYKTIQIDPSNLPIQWWYNQLLMDTTKYNGSIIRHIGEGNYQASVIDNAQCTWYSNIINLQFDDQIAVYPNPTSNEIGLLVQDVFGEYWTWQITNSLGQVLATRKVQTPFDIINVREWAPGAYSIRIIYQNSPNPRMARFIKQ